MMSQKKNLRDWILIMYEIKYRDAQIVGHYKRATDYCET